MLDPVARLVSRVTVPEGLTANATLVRLSEATGVPVEEFEAAAGDAAALGNLYSSWNSPAQLAGWSAAGGDPCGAAWTGVSCSGTAVTSLKLSGMELNGTLGYELSSLQALKTMDLSNNFLHDAIPYQLPPNLTYLNLAKNNLSGNLPYSISTLVSLEYL
jgi:hypothetical protein